MQKVKYEVAASCRVQGSANHVVLASAAWVPKVQTTWSFRIGDSFNACPMTYSKIIELRSAKDPARRLSLEYVDEPVKLVQPRVVGRRAVKPAIDLGDYSCRAALDWLDISFELGRPTQFRYVQHVIESVTSRLAFVEPASPGPGGVDTIFNVRVQDPHLHQIRECARSLEAKFGGKSEPYVYGLEVSVDFYPSVPSDDSRGLMTAVLSRHFWPSRDVVSKLRDRPRFAWGRRARQTMRTLGLDRRDDDILLNTAGDRHPTLDATYYIGQRIGRAMWRVMDKVRDRQRSRRWLDLPDAEKRARVEVRLDRLELKQLGVISLKDLLSFNLASLQGQYFQFMLPTFTSPGGPYSNHDKYWERYRHERFLATGVVGLQAMDEERERLRKVNRPELVRQLRAKGVKVAPARRAGSGRNGTLIAYKELNDRVAMALRKLQEREERLLNRGS